MDHSYKYSYVIDSRAIDYFNCCRPSALLGFMQEAATSASREMHMTNPEVIEKYGVFWMLARVWYRLDRPLRWNEVLTIHTWHRGSKTAVLYRDFDLFVNGVPVGEAVSTWVLADVESHKLARFSKIAELTDSTGGSLCKDKTLSKLQVPADLPLAERRLLHYSETDMNQHINNIHYADFACDALRLEQIAQGQYVSSLQISYLAECLPGETIDLCAGQQDGRWYVHGTDGDQKPCFDAALELSPIF